MKMDKDTRDRDRAIELLSNRAPLSISQAEQLFEILTKHRRHTVHRDVANYLANDAGMNKNKIEEILDRRIEARNVDQLIKERVARYFSSEKDEGSGLDRAIHGAVEHEVRRCIRHKMEEGALAYIEAKSGELCKQLFGTEGQPGTKAPGMDSVRNVSPDRKYVVVCNEHPAMWRGCMLFWGHLTKDHESRSFGGYTSDISACERYAEKDLDSRGYHFKVFDPESMSPDDFRSERDIAIEPRHLEGLGLKTMQVWYQP